MEGKVGDAGPDGVGHKALTVYEAQVPQLPELQPEQECPVLPGMAWGTPESLEIKPLKTDILRRAALWQRGHSAVLSDWLNGRIFSNLESHSGQRYSYIGIFDLLLIV
jgi:hypothetical protein